MQSKEFVFYCLDSGAVDAQCRELKQLKAIHVMISLLGPQTSNTHLSNAQIVLIIITFN